MLDEQHDSHNVDAFYATHLLIRHVQPILARNSGWAVGFIFEP